MKARMGIKRLRKTVEIPVDCANGRILFVVFCVNCCNFLNSYVFWNQYMFDKKCSWKKQTKNEAIWVIVVIREQANMYGVTLT